jgi:hypothetical protein
MDAPRDLLGLLVLPGFLADAEAGRLRRRADETDRAQVVVLRETRAVDDETILGALMRHLGRDPAPLPDDAAVDLEAVRALPRAIADAHLVLPLRLEDRTDERVLRLAMADPLATLSIRAVEAATGLNVEPQLAHAADVEAAIERLYGRIVTRLIPRRTATGRQAWVPAQSSPGEPHAPADVPQTAPEHRLEDEATAAQRVEAILTVLEARGLLTRAEYVAALRQILEAESEP